MRKNIGAFLAILGAAILMASLFQACVNIQVFFGKNALQFGLELLVGGCCLLAGITLAEKKHG